MTSVDRLFLLLRVFSTDMIYQELIDIQQHVDQ